MEEFASGLIVSEMLILQSAEISFQMQQDNMQISGNANQFRDGTMFSAQANAVSGAAGETAGIYIESKLILNIVLIDRLTGTPYLTGTAEIAETMSVQLNLGVGVTLKHHAGNNQENNCNAVNHKLLKFY